MQGNKGLHMVAWVLVIIGGLNWLLVGLFSWDLVAAIFGMSVVTKVIYILVGVAAVYELVCHKATCKMCDSGAKPMANTPPLGGMGMPR